MRIVINASPETWASITYFDGMDNQIYPPRNINILDVVSYIKDISNEFDIHEIVVSGPQSYISKLVEDLKNNFKNVNIKTI